MGGGRRERERKSGRERSRERTVCFGLMPRPGYTVCRMEGTGNAVSGKGSGSGRLWKWKGVDVVCSSLSGGVAGVGAVMLIFFVF